MRGVVFGHVIAIAQQSALDPLDPVGASGAHIQIAPCLHQRVPQGHADVAAFDIDLEPALLGITRARDHHVAALEIEMAKAEEPDRAHRVAKDARHQLIGFRPLHRQGRDIGFTDQDIKAIAIGDALDPQQQIAVGDGDPPPILGQFHRHRIVQHAARLIDHRDVVALPRQHAPQIARCQHLHQLGRIGAAQFHLPLAGHVPDLHRRFQVVVILLDRAEDGRQQHAVIDSIGAHACGLDPVGKGCAAQAARGRDQRHSGTSSGIKGRSVSSGRAPAAVSMACTWPR